MATKLGVGNEVNMQHARVGAVWRTDAELIAPQTMGLPGRPLVPCQTDHIGALARLRGKLEVTEDHLLEVPQDPCHGPPIAEIEDARGCRSADPCPGTPAGKSWLA